MLDLLIDYIANYTPLTAKEKDYLIDHVDIRTFDKHAVIFQEGEVATDIYFVLQGCVRLFYNVEGNEKTAFFYSEGQFICAGDSYTFHRPAKENYEALENTTLCVFSPNTIDLLMEYSSTFENIARIAVENELLTAQRIISSFVTQTAAQRYVDLINHQKELFQRVPQHYIATFLGVSPETLSRIRSRLMKK